MGENIVLTRMELRLLRFLMLNGAHHSIYAIGKNLRVSPQTVAYKIKKFEDDGVICSYHYRLNPYKIGFRNMAWCAFDVNRHKDIEGLEERVLSHPNIFAVYSLAGQVDMFAKVFYSRHRELNELIEWMGINFRDFVSRVSIVPVMQAEKLYQSECVSSERDVLDETSKRILGYKLSHTEASLKETANELGLHRNTVSRRWKQLWSDGVLLKKSLYVHPEVYKQLGFGVSACVFVDVVPGKRKEFIEKVLGRDEIHELFSLAFKHDMLAIIRSKDIDECYSTIKSLYYSKCVNDTETLIILSNFEETVPLSVH